MAAFETNPLIKYGHKMYQILTIGRGPEHRFQSRVERTLSRKHSAATGGQCRQEFSPFANEKEIDVQ